MLSYEHTGFTKAIKSGQSTESASTCQFIILNIKLQEKKGSLPGM